LSACEDEPAAFIQAGAWDQQLQVLNEIAEPASASAGASQRDSDERQSGE
jgi:hypothetical protein